MGLRPQRPAPLRTGLLWGLALGLGITACHTVAGIDDRTFDPSLMDGGQAGGPDADAAEERDSGNECSLVGEGDAALRFVHVASQNTAFDLCFRRQNESRWQSVLQALPRGCSWQGLSRAAATMALPVPAGTYDMRVGLPPDCTQFRAGEWAGVQIPPGRSLAVVLAEDQDRHFVLETYLEHKEDRRSFRFMNLIATGETIDVGWGEMVRVHDVLPEDQRIAELAFGQAPTPLPGAAWPQVDEAGYLIDEHFQHYGAALHGQPPAIATTTVPWTENVVSPLYVIGRSDDYTFPIQILRCDEHRGDGRFADCKTSLPPLKDGSEIRVGAFAANLQGSLSTDGPKRQEALSERLSQLGDDGPDVLCLSEVASPHDYEAIRLAAQEVYPYVAYVQHDRTTPFKQPERPSGLKPPLYDEYMSTPPCPASDPTLVQAFEDMIDCLRERCSTEPGALTGHVSQLECVIEDCSNRYNELRIRSNQAGQWRCLSCLEAGVNDESPLSSIQTRCTTDPAGGWTFDGRSSDVILSRWPFVDNAVESWVLPSSYVRRAIVRATVMTGTPTGVDVYCTSLSELGSTFDGGYPGIYGAGADGDDAWAAEQFVQATQLCDWVAESSKGRQAVVAGKMNASDEHRNDQGVVIVKRNEGDATIAFLNQNLTPAVPATYAPAFTECPAGDTCPPGLWTTRLYTYGEDSPKVVSTETLFEGEMFSTSHGLTSRISFTGGTNAPAGRP